MSERTTGNLPIMKTINIDNHHFFDLKADNATYFAGNRNFSFEEDNLRLYFKSLK